MFLVLLVLHKNDQLEEVLDAWDQTGVGGITILPSTGMGRIRYSALNEAMPIIPTLEDLLEHTERLNRTIFSIVKGQEMVDKLVEATESVTGDLNNPNTGILVVLPVLQSYGLNRRPE